MDRTGFEPIGPHDFRPVPKPRPGPLRRSPCGCTFRTVVTAAADAVGGWDVTDVQVASCGEHRFPGGAAQAVAP